MQVIAVRDLCCRHFCSLFAVMFAVGFYSAIRVFLRFKVCILAISQPLPLNLFVVMINVSA